MSSYKDGTTGLKQPRSDCNHQDTGQAIEAPQGILIEAHLLYFVEEHADPVIAESHFSLIDHLDVVEFFRGEIALERAGYGMNDMFT